MSIESNLVLYHCNDEKRCSRFVNSDKYMIVSHEDGSWLGQGMYFWDNLGNAKYWMGEKRRKEPSQKYEIVKARVSMEQLLDLTDIEVCEALQKLWDECEQKMNLPKGEKAELGLKLNTLCRNIEMFNNAYHVYKVFGKYNRTPKIRFITYDLTSDKVEPILSIKTIYNVKKHEAILEKAIVEEKKI
ncbi:hypothetical protein [Clostridium sp.]